MLKNCVYLNQCFTLTLSLRFSIAFKTQPTEPSPPGLEHGTQHLAVDGTILEHFQDAYHTNLSPAIKQETLVDTILEHFQDAYHTNLSSAIKHETVVDTILEHFHITQIYHLQLNMKQ